MLMLIGMISWYNKALGNLNTSHVNVNRIGM